MSLAKIGCLTTCKRAILTGVLAIIRLGSCLMGKTFEQMVDLVSLIPLNIKLVQVQLVLVN